MKKRKGERLSQGTKDTSHYRSSLNANALCIIKDQQVRLCRSGCLPAWHPTARVYVYAKLQDLFYRIFENHKMCAYSFQKHPTLMTGSDTPGESKWQPGWSSDLWYLPPFAHPASSTGDLPRKPKQMGAARCCHHSGEQQEAGSHPTANCDTKET